MQDEGGVDPDQTDIERLIIQLNDKARLLIDDEEKRKRRKPGAQRIVETPLDQQADIQHQTTSRSDTADVGVKDTTISQPINK